MKIWVFSWFHWWFSLPEVQQNKLSWCSHSTINRTWRTSPHLHLWVSVLGCPRGPHAAPLPSGQLLPGGAETSFNGAWMYGGTMWLWGSPWDFTNQGGYGEMFSVRLQSCDSPDEVKPPDCLFAELMDHHQCFIGPGGLSMTEFLISWFVLISWHHLFAVTQPLLTFGLFVCSWSSGQCTQVETSGNISTLSTGTAAPSGTVGALWVMYACWADCVTDGNQCRSNLCINGTCVDLYRAYTCSCNKGYEGKYCDQRESV